MRTLILGATLLFLAAFAALTIHAAWDRGFTILSVISLLIIGLHGDRHRRRDLGGPARRRVTGARPIIPRTSSIDWPVSQRRRGWISTTLQSRPQYRAQIRAWLDEHQAQAPVLLGDGALTDPDEILDARRAWQAQARRGRPRGRHVAEGVRRPGRRPDRGRDHQPGDAPRARPGHPRRHRRRHARPDDHRPRHRRAEDAATSARCSTATRCGASSSASRPPARTSPRCRPARSRTTTARWTLNGQKVWTTNAQFAAYGLLLARTNADVPKHKGMTMFIVPMDADGVTVRGLRQISGEAEFNEVFFDDVTIPADSVVGGVDNGWGVGADDAHVRAPDDRPRQRGLRLQRRRASPARSPARRRRGRKDSDVRHQLGEIAAELEAIRWTGYRLISDLQGGQIPGPEFGLAKVTTVNNAVRAGDLIADVLGPETLAEDDEWAYMISFLPGLKSAGGTEEILRNTIGERVLGLPPEPRLDKGIPFSELRAKEKEGAAA